MPAAENYVPFLSGKKKPSKTGEDKETQCAPRLAFTELFPSTTGFQWLMLSQAATLLAVQTSPF